MSCTSYAFDTVESGQEVYIPGLNRTGRVVEIRKTGKSRQMVSVILSDGREVGYSRKTWYAVSVDSVPPTVKPNRGAKVGKDLVRPDVVVQGTVRPRSRRVVGTPPAMVDPVPRHDDGFPASSRAARPLKHPYIPGEPVPKPSAGVWTEEMRKWYGHEPERLSDTPITSVVGGE